MLSIDFNGLVDKIVEKYKRGNDPDDIAIWLGQALHRNVRVSVVNFFLDITGSFAERNSDIVYDYYTNKLKVCELAAKYYTSQQEVFRIIKESPQYKALNTSVKFKIKHPRLQEIITDYKTHDYSLEMLGEKYGCSGTHIKNLLVSEGVYVYMNRGCYDRKKSVGVI